MYTSVTEGKLLEAALNLTSPALKFMGVWVCSNVKSTPPRNPVPPETPGAPVGPVGPVLPLT